METIEEYLKATESATKKLFEGIESYISIWREVETPVFVAEYSTEAEFRERAALWAEQNRLAIDAKIEAQERYIDELFAQSTLCGAVLQIAAMGIKKYSSNSVIPEEFRELPKIERAKKYCIGRKIKNVPIGLIIFAGRNQYNHLDENSLHEPSNAIFRTIATVGPSKFVKKPFLDPCFDITNPTLDNYASNITALLGWRAYKSYESDMLQMIRDGAT